MAKGTDADSNILKIYRMLDRNNGDKHYYQPGIGTYVNSRSLSHTSTTARLKSWYQKAKDSAVGSSFDEHGAYKFLMSCYDNHDIYFFGFSRGAYVARFLAEMLDHVGLLSAGNEEMARFAWKAFAQWQEREEGTEQEKKKKREMLEFLQAFRDTFSRPVRRIRFLGLFDTARSSAMFIRHAVSIDERRAKFRQDLISESKSARSHSGARHHHHLLQGRKPYPTDTHRNATMTGLKPNPNQVDRFRRPSRVRPISGGKNRSASPQGDMSVGRGRLGRSDMDAASVHSTPSSLLPQHIQNPEDSDEENETAKQDIEELWFPGCHADLGGGWPLADGEESALSHGPLVWMVREAQRAGLEFDSEKMLSLRCCDDTFSNDTYPPQCDTAMPEIQVTGTQSDVNLFNSPKQEKQEPGWAPGMKPLEPKKTAFQQALESAATQGHLHDCLEFNNGLPASSVISWKIMEYLPFRRMDLGQDGRWKAISLPLPMGETRDIPENAWIHNSAIRRMEADPNYRPGNLIIGGGGRGVRKAPKHLGIGEWEVLKGDGDPVGMVYISIFHFENMFRACFHCVARRQYPTQKASLRGPLSAYASNLRAADRWRWVAQSREMSRLRLRRNRARMSQGTVGIVATILVSGLLVSYGILTTKPLALDNLEPGEGVQSWGSQRFVPVTVPRSVDQANSILRWEEGSRAIGGSVTRADHVQVPSNLPPEDTMMQTVAKDDTGLLWLIAGIFDGHAGLETAQALKKYLIHYLIRELHADAAELPSSKEADKAITRAFLDLDRDIMDVATQAVEGSRLLADALAEVSPAYSGSCALVSYYNEELREVKVACTGDSRAVLGRRNNTGEWKAVPLSSDQTCYNNSEVARLKADHPNEPEMIGNGRLLGLAVTRAFGDSRWKWSREIQEKARDRFFGPELRESLLTPPYLTAEPVITTTRVDPDGGDFIILASDGLWDCITSEQAVDLVGRWMETHDVTKPAPLPDLAAAVPDVLAPSDLSQRMEPMPDAKYTEQRKIMEKDYVVVDENAATHLARHAFGGGNEDLLTGMATPMPPLTRRLRCVFRLLDNIAD
ncbi:MAG: hypothetical protein Q9163_001429 [Psora crenata]